MPGDTNRYSVMTRVLALPLPTFLKSILRLKSESFLPQIHGFFHYGFELRTELGDIKMLVTARPGHILFITYVAKPFISFF